MTQVIKEPEAQKDEGGSTLNSNMEVPDESIDYKPETDHTANEHKVPISELRKIRAEAAKYRKRLRDLENKISEERKITEISKMEETDRLRAIAEEAEIKARNLKKRADNIAKQAAVISAASSAGFYNPKDAAVIVDLSQIEVDNDGNVDPEIVNETVFSLAESKPYLVKGQQIDQEMVAFGPTNPPSLKWPQPKLQAKDRIGQIKQKSIELMKGGNMRAGIKLYNRLWEEERGIKKPTGGQY